MRKIVMLLTIVTAVMMLTSCKKEAVTNPDDIGKTFVRVKEVSTTGAEQYSWQVVTYVKN